MPRRLNKTCLVTRKFPAKLLSPLDVQALNCPLSFFATNSYNVVGVSFRCPSPAVINFNPAAWQTTSRKRRYPDPMYTFLYGYRCTCLSKIEVQLCRLTWFKRRIIDRSLQGTIHNQCHSINARRETFENVTTVLICFNGREQPAAILSESTKYCDSYCAEHREIIADHLSKARWSSAGSPLRIRDMP